MLKVEWWKQTESLLSFGFTRSSRPDPDGRADKVNKAEIQRCIEYIWCAIDINEVQFQPHCIDVKIVFL